MPCKIPCKCEQPCRETSGWREADVYIFSNLVSLVSLKLCDLTTEARWSYNSVQHWHLVGLHRNYHPNPKNKRSLCQRENHHCYEIVPKQLVAFIIVLRLINLFQSLWNDKMRTKEKNGTLSERNELEHKITSCNALHRAVLRKRTLWATCQGNLSLSLNVRAIILSELNFCR